jgi:hypothetical protein
MLAAIGFEFFQVHETVRLDRRPERIEQTLGALPGAFERLERPATALHQLQQLQRRIHVAVTCRVLTVAERRALRAVEPRRSGFDHLVVESVGL